MRATDENSILLIKTLVIICCEIDFQNQIKQALIKSVILYFLFGA